MAASNTPKITVIKSTVILLSRDFYVILIGASHITVIHGLFKVCGDIKITLCMISHVTVFSLVVADIFNLMKSLNLSFIYDLMPNLLRKNMS